MTYTRKQDGDVIVHAADLVAGDMVVARLDERVNHDPFDPYQYPMRIVSRIASNDIQYRVTFSLPSGESSSVLFLCSLDSVWVRRGGASPDGKRVIPDYPHLCPRCGRKAYVGAFMVRHSSPAGLLENPCPAEPRR